NIAYLEKNGNIFINYENWFILIDANKPVDLAKETGNRAFTKTGLKVVYLYLTEENWLNKPQREIAKKTDTGLGNISNINHGLQKEKFLLKVNRTQKQLNNKKELLEKWMKVYAVTLQPELKTGQFRFADEKNFVHYRKTQLDVNTWWGGEPAGDILTDYLRPGELTLYTNNTRTELMKKLKLIPDPNGNVRIFKAFWNTKNQPRQNTVHPLLVYVDLMNTGDNRCYETARMIWDKYLAHEF
ncbi:MAG: type IV toxin-antitoxin system AbiEi family antitoxin, partial [Mariniphaga sp.]